MCLVRLRWTRPISDGDVDGEGRLHTVRSQIKSRPMRLVRLKTDMTNASCLSQTDKTYK